MNEKKKRFSNVDFEFITFTFDLFLFKYILIWISLPILFNLLWTLFML